MKTWEALIRNAAKRLTSGGIDEGVATAEYLAAFVLSVWNRSELRPFLQQAPTPGQYENYENAIVRRLQHEPLQYIVGETEFYGLRLYCSPAALIPRPETEILVEEALKEIARFAAPVRILDIGTGSGAIAFALAARYPEAQVIAIDRSDDALALAERNKHRLGIVNVELLRASFPEGFDRALGPFDLIVSNPPYVPQAEWELLETDVRDYEPVIALTDNRDGFWFYEAIASESATLLRKGGVVLVETEFKGAPRVCEIFRARGLTIARVVRDLLGHERVVVASRA